MVAAQCGKTHSNQAAMVLLVWLSESRYIHRWPLSSLCSAPTIFNLCTSTPHGSLPKAFSRLSQPSAPRLLSRVCPCQEYWWLRLLRSNPQMDPSRQSSKAVRRSVWVWPPHTKRYAMRLIAPSSMLATSLRPAKSMACILMQSSTWFLAMSYAESPRICWRKMRSNNAINTNVRKRRFALLLHAGYGVR